MAKVIFGNHMSVIVPRVDRDAVQKFYCEALGAVITKAEDDRDFIRLGDDFYIVLYGDVPDASEFHRSARAVWLEIKSDDVGELGRRILDAGARKLEVPDPHLYFQAPGGQCLRLVGIDEDLSFYEGSGKGPDVKAHLGARAADGGASGKSVSKQGQRPKTATLSAAEVARAITDNEIVLATVEVPVAPERALGALMTNECEKWWGAPGVYTIEAFRADPRQGGHWSLVIRLPDGTALPSSGEFVEVAPNKIVQTRRYDFDHPTLGRRVTKVTTHFLPSDRGTRIVVRHEDFGASEPAVEHAGGWERMLDWLGTYLRSEPAVG